MGHASHKGMLDRIAAYECGELDEHEALELLADLISCGIIWSLQGSWQRAASEAVRNGYISESGEVIA